MNVVHESTHAATLSGAVNEDVKKARQPDQRSKDMVRQMDVRVRSGVYD